MEETDPFKKINTSIFENEILKNQLDAVLVFSADWSGNSEMMNSIMQRLSQEYDQINFYKIDIEKYSDIASFFGIYNVPSAILLHEGEIKEWIKGLAPAHKIRKKLNSSYPTYSDQRKK